MKKNKLRNFFRKAHTIASLGILTATSIMNVGTVVAHAAEDENMGFCCKVSRQTSFRLK